MTDLTAQQIEELERLEAAATPGEWFAFETYTGEEGAFEVGPGEFDTVAHVRQGNDELTGDAKSNAAFIAAIRNAAKPLLTMAERLNEARHIYEEQASEIAELRRQLAESNRLKDIFMKDAASANGILERMRRGA